MLEDDRGATVDVLYVLRCNAKTVKTSLEKEGLLHKQYRMTLPHDTSLQDTCIAIPILDEGLEKDGDWISMVVSIGRQYCPFSSSFMGNNKSKQTTFALSRELSTQVQKALLTALIQCSPQDLSTERKNEIVQRIKDLSFTVCPKKLEVIGDDRTLVIPRRAFHQDDDEFASVCSLVVGGKLSDWKSFWKYFAMLMESPRVVRRGDIDPDSSIRESGHRLLWPHSGQTKETGTFANFELPRSSFDHILV